MPNGSQSMPRTAHTILFAAALAGSVLTLAPATAIAQETIPPERRDVRVARLVRQLGSDDYTERTEADRELARLGPAGQRQLQAALVAGDAEIRLRAQDLLRRLEVLQLWDPPPIELSCRERPLKEAVAELAASSGNRLLVGEQHAQYNDQQVTLQVRGDGFWQIMDEVCRQSGNHVRPHYNPRVPALVLTSGPLGRYPVAYSGPIRAQLTGARRAYTEQVDFEQFAADVSHTFQLNMQVMWEDRFRLVAYRAQPELLQATTDTGEPVSAVQMGGNSWNVAEPGMRQLTAVLKLQPPPIAAQSLAQLKLHWDMIAVGQMATLEIKDLVAGRKHHADDLQVTVEEIDQRPAGRWLVTLLVSRDLAVPEPQEILLHENLLQLWDAAGKQFEESGQSNSLAPGGARIKATFLAPAGDAAPSRLVLSYPRIRAQKRVEIAFKDVPLPQGRPK